MSGRKRKASTKQKRATATKKQCTPTTNHQQAETGVSLSCTLRKANLGESNNMTSQMANVMEFMHTNCFVTTFHLLMTLKDYFSYQLRSADELKPGDLDLTRLKPHHQQPHIFIRVCVHDADSKLGHAWVMYSDAEQQCWQILQSYVMNSPLQKGPRWTLKEWIQLTDMFTSPSRKELTNIGMDGLRSIYKMLQLDEALLSHVNCDPKFKLHLQFLFLE